MSAWPFQGLFCMPAGSPLQVTAPRSERPRRMHTLTCLGLESAGLNNCRSSWQSQIVDVFISLTRVGVPLAPFSREASFSFPIISLFRGSFSQTNSDSPLFPANIRMLDSSLHVPVEHSKTDIRCIALPSLWNQPLLRNTEEAGENMNVCVPIFRASSTFWLNASFNH